MNNIILPERKFVELLDFNQTTTDVLAIGWNACLDEISRLNQPTAGAGVVVGALVSALEGIVHDERVPNEVSQDYAALLIEARRLNPCRAQAVPKKVDHSAQWPTTPGLSARPSDDELWDQTLSERDSYHESADKLTAAIADHFGQDFGEHSSLNEPWVNALDFMSELAAAPSTQQKESGDE